MLVKVFIDWKIHGESNKNYEDSEIEINKQNFTSHLKKGIPFFIISGFTAHLLGIGGGVINTPACHLILGFPIHISTATST